SEEKDFPASSGGRCKGVKVAVSQNPCRSGSPHAVRGGVQFAAAAAAAFADSAAALIAVCGSTDFGSNAFVPEGACAMRTGAHKMTPAVNSARTRLRI